MNDRERIEQLRHYDFCWDQASAMDAVDFLLAQIDKRDEAVEDAKEVLEGVIGCDGHHYDAQDLLAKWSVSGEGK